MSVRFTVGGNVYELRPGSGVGKTALQAGSKLLSTVQQFLESHCLGDRPIVEKKVDLAAGGKLGQISARGINAPAANVFPASSTQLARLPCLSWSKYCKLDPQFGKDIQRLQIDCCFRQPQALGKAPETALEVAN